jgi:hypothetical protein
MFVAQPPSGFGLALLVVAILIPLHAWMEGMHWQMAPSYAAAGVLLLWQSGIFSGDLARHRCAVVALLLLILSLGFSWTLPMFQLPRPTGKYPVGTRMLHLIDPDRAEMHAGAWPGNREITVQLWYPAATAKWPRAMYRRRNETTLRSSYQAVLPTHSLQDAPVASGRFPVVLYNPAWHGFRHRGTFMTQELASHGFVVAGISHPYNSSIVELSDGRVALPDYSLDLGFSLDRYIPLDQRLALADEELVIQTQDCRFLLDELQRFDRSPGHPLEGRLHMDRVGGYGYSFGGAVSVELAREDPRVCSALELDGVLHGAAAKHGLDKPLMLIDSRWMVAPEEHHDAEDVRLAETARMWKIIADTKARALTRCGGIRVIVEGLGHADFSDQIFMSPLRQLSRAGVVPPVRVVHILNSYTVAFFRKTLCNSEQQILCAGEQPFPEAMLHSWKPSAVDTASQLR